MQYFMVLDDCIHRSETSGDLRLQAPAMGVPDETPVITWLVISLLFSTAIFAPTLLGTAFSSSSTFKC